MVEKVFFCIWDSFN